MGKSQKELLEEDLAKSIKEFGPGSGSAKHLRAQLASLGTVRHPSQLAVSSSEGSDKYHGAVLKKDDSAPTETVQEAYERQGTDLAKKDQ